MYKQAFCQNEGRRLIFVNSLATKGFQSIVTADGGISGEPSLSSFWIALLNPTSGDDANPIYQKGLGGLSAIWTAAAQNRVI